ncbi:hypothetical protein QOZ80_5BG0417370 [Eleusine coracana subsp. coracana]|nr:hypothetical protein QOZ80_5BG0417370 [Eleusine coracana subsp. coracana]
METSRKAVASGLLLCLFLVHSGMTPSVLASDDCWETDHFHYVICFHQPKCRSSCQDHGFVDGRCAGFPNLVPMCECQRANCPA